MTRRELIGAMAAAPLAQAQAKALTKFQLACMTLPYGAFPLERALTGIKQAGYDFVAWGTSHQKKPVMPLEPSTAAVWGFNR
jgi:hypothetical protein